MLWMNETKKISETESESPRCWCGKFKAKEYVLCDGCYRKIFRDCPKCTEYREYDNVDAGETYTFCEKHKCGVEQAKCFIFMLPEYNKKIHNKVMALIRGYNDKNQRYTHYVLLSPKLLVEIRWHARWDYYFSLLEHYKQGCE